MEELQDSRYSDQPAWSIVQVENAFFVPTNIAKIQGRSCMPALLQVTAGFKRASKYYTQRFMKPQMVCLTLV